VPMTLDFLRISWTNHLIFVQSKARFRAKTALIIVRTSYDFSIRLLVVDESARGKGIGRKLIQHTERELSERGCATLISDVWQDAVGFYQALGWSVPGAVLLRQRLPALQ
jgi:GNAT superfamily N-acetyltransferase